MGRKEITTKEDLMKVIELFENTGITYWLDGGWGVDILAGKQTRIHRDIDINFDAQHTEKLLNVLLNLGYKIDTDWKLGFVGRNGRGKTTFLKLLLGKYEYSGKIVCPVQFDYFPYAVSDKKQLTENILQEVCPNAES